jgi:hypothetical protein
MYFEGQDSEPSEQQRAADEDERRSQKHPRRKGLVPGPGFVRHNHLPHGS